jgi:APA family basic amino acid/polyamine antiporter
LVVAFVIAFQSIIATYDGWYSAIYFMEEDRDPTRNLPRSALGGVACSIAIFLLVNMALLYVLPLPQLASSNVPGADAARIIFGKAGQQILLLISLLTVLGVINATLLIAPRILFALGRDGLFFRQAAEVNVGVSCLSWKWRKRSSVKITERTYEEGTEAFHRRRKSSHPEAASFGQGARLGAV